MTCGGGIGGMFWFLNYFFSPFLSVIESPLSLLLFRFIDVSISSCDTSGTFIFSFFPFSVFVLEFSNFFSVFVLEFSVFFFSSVLLFSLVLAGSCFSDDFGTFERDFFLLRVTWVHPSSSFVIGAAPSFRTLCVCCYWRGGWNSSF